MNNYGNISFNNNLSRSSNLSMINTKAPVSATANSRIKLSTGEFDIQETIISTEVTASNPSVAAARATAKAASIATSTLTGDNNKYLSQHDLQNNFTFQISTYCTIQKVKPELIEINQSTDPYVSMNSITHDNMKNSTKNVSTFQKGTKFEKLRRELEYLGQDKVYHQNDFFNDFHVDSLNKSSRLSTFSTMSNMSTSSSIKSEPMTYRSILSEPLTYSSDNTNQASNENIKSKYNTQRQAFLNSELDSSDSNSNGKRYRISDLKRSDKVNNSEGKLRDVKTMSSNNRDINSLYCMQTIPGSSYEKSFTFNRDIGTLFSNSSSLLETDLDSATLSIGNLFPQTDFHGNQSAFSFEKTRSMIDIRKNSDVSYDVGLTRAVSSEDLKKSKPVEDSNFIKRLKSKAQSTQELRIADSLTKLNVPEWMKDFKTKDLKYPLSQAYERKSTMSFADSNTLKFKDIKRHDSILSKYKYESLSMSRINLKNQEQLSKISQVNLPSSLYRSKSQNLVYFNPKEDSKLKSAMESLNSSLKTLKVDKDSETLFQTMKENPIMYLESKSTENKYDEIAVKRATSSRQDLKSESNFKDFEVQNSGIMQNRRENKVENSTEHFTSTYHENKNENQNFNSGLKNPEKKIEFSNIHSNPRSSESSEIKVENSTKRFESRYTENRIENPNLYSTFKSQEVKSEVPKILSPKSGENKIQSPNMRLESNSTENKIDEIPVKHSTSARQDLKGEMNFKNFEIKDNIVMQNKKESQIFLQKIVESTLNPFLVIDDICTAFRINPTTLKLLLNVKRKTPNLNRDETFANMKVNETSYIENSLRKNCNNKYVIFCDFKSCKNELFHSSKISRTTCSCYNCYIYYCSKKCRNMGFSQHFHACSFKRIRETLLKIKCNINEEQIQALSKYAFETYKSYGCGLMTIAFESCRSADDFLNKQPNRLMSQPYYIKYSDLVEIDSIDFMDYDPETEFVTCLIISATLPMTSVELSYPTFKHCYKIKYPFQQSILTTNSNTFISTKIPKELTNENSNTKVKFEDGTKPADEKTSAETRKEFFNYVLNFFETKNVNLIQNYSSIYRKLENYMLEGTHFEPLTVYIKDPLINSTVSCTIYPNKDITLKPVRTATKPNKSADHELKQNGSKTLAETEI